jgi:hypothetical protein
MLILIVGCGYLGKPFPDGVISHAWEWYAAESLSAVRYKAGWNVMDLQPVVASMKFN